jgi:hypothetical protein
VMRGEMGFHGVPCGKPARKTLGSGGIDDGREKHPKFRDDGDAAYWYDWGSYPHLPASQASSDHSPPRS